MVRPDGKFPVKPEGTNPRPILIGHAMRYESVIRNGHKVFSGFAARPEESDGVLTHRPLVLKSNVL